MQMKFKNIEDYHIDLNFYECEQSIKVKDLFNIFLEEISKKLYSQSQEEE